MKYYRLIALTAFLFYGCGGKKIHITNNPNDLNYTTEESSSEVLSVDINLTGNKATGILTAQLQLKNTGSKSISIQEITIETTDAIRSIPEHGNAGITLKAGKDSVFSLKFHPINNLQLFKTTGMQGSLKPVYNVMITCNAESGGQATTITIPAKANKNDFLNYTKTNSKKIIGYSFNTKTGFNEKEKKYLESAKVAQPPFVYLSDHEIALSGLNFRYKSYYLKDTLYAGLFIVNHADFLVKFTPDNFDINKNGIANPDEKKSISFEKVSGSKQDQTMMEKGDRLFIHFKKHFKSPIAAKEILIMNLMKAFWLTGKKQLFTKDIQLTPTLFTEAPTAVLQDTF